jgi:hypothetical protein
MDRQRLVEYLREEEIKDEKMINENHRPNYGKRRMNGKTNQRKMDYGMMNFKWLNIFIRYYLLEYNKKENLLKQYGIRRQTFRDRYQRWCSHDMPTIQTKDEFDNLVPIPGTEDNRGKNERKRILTSRQEHILKKDISQLLDHGEIVTDKTVQQQARKIFTQSHPHVTRSSSAYINKKKFSRCFVYLLRKRLGFVNAIALYVSKEKIEITEDKKKRNEQVQRRIRTIQKNIWE